MIIFKIQKQLNLIHVRKKGMEKGLEQGIEKGIEQEKINIAKNLLKMNMNIDDISKSTGLPVKKIKEL